MIKAVFFDIDGTLVSFNTHRMPDSTIQALNELRRKGIKIFIATGRPPASITNLENIKFDGYITMNGGCCSVEGEIIYKNPIPKNNVEALIKYIENTVPFPCFFADGNEPFCNFSSELSDKIFESLKIPPPKIAPIRSALEKDIYQISAFFDKQDEEKILSLLPDCKTVSWSPYFSDIIPKKGDKQVGIDAMLAHFGIPLEATMAFGDGGNDISMLRHVKTGIAMGNADEEVKQAADYVTASVDDDGIWKALKYFNLIC